jgi:D-alanine-D-alanine ligase
MKKVLIFHSPLTRESSADELDVLDESAFFSQGLADLGFLPETISFPYDLWKLKSILGKHRPDFVVNLVETLFSDGRLVHIGPALFEHLNVPYTGCPADAIYLTSHKVLAKKIIKSAGIFTPAFLTFNELQSATVKDISKKYIIKSIWEHASFGLNEDEKLLFEGKGEIMEKFSGLNSPHDFFCEEYIHGREFNLSVLGGLKGPEVLPHAEIRFSFPDDKPHVLGYKAKWDEGSFEYMNTVRTFDFVPEDSDLLKELSEIALESWKLFGLKGYARVDFRVDQDGKIYVLEINANPCISPDSGFVAAAIRAGLSQKELVKRIVQDIKR